MPALSVRTLPQLVQYHLDGRKDTIDVKARAMDPSVGVGSALVIRLFLLFHLILHSSLRCSLCRPLAPCFDTKITSSNFFLMTYHSKQLKVPSDMKGSQCRPAQGHTPLNTHLYLAIGRSAADEREQASATTSDVANLLNGILWSFRSLARRQWSHSRVIPLYANSHWTRSICSEEEGDRRCASMVIVVTSAAIDYGSSLISR